MELIHLLENLRDEPRAWRRRDTLAKILRHADSQTEIQDTIEALELCGEPMARRVGGHEIRWFYHRCKQPACEQCSIRAKEKEAERAQEKISEHAEGSINPAFLSWVSVDDKRLPLGSDFRPEAQKLKRALRYRLGRDLHSAAFHGGLEIAVQGQEGMLHVHGWLYHPGTPRAKVREILKRSFKGHKAVHVTQMHSNKKTKENISTATKYACKGIGNKREDIVQEYGTDAPEVLARWIRSMNSMWSGGRRGLRVEIGFDNKVDKKTDDIDDPVKWLCDPVDVELSDGSLMNDDVYDVDDSCEDDEVYCDDMVGLRENCSWECEEPDLIEAEMLADHGGPP